jgi:hypothetical protein
MAKQPATLAQAKQIDERTARQKYNLDTYGTNQPNVEDVKKNADLTRQQNLYQSSVAQGATPEEARAAAQSLGVGSATPKLDKMAYDESQRQDKLGGTPNSDLGRFKTYGDKSTFETQQALRSLRGEAPLANNAQEFQKQLDKSSSFNEKSGLQTEGGRARALQSGMAAGLSQSDAQSMIDTANANILKGISDRTVSAAKDKQQAQAITAGLMGGGSGYNPNSLTTPFTPKATTSVTAKAPDKTVAGTPKAATGTTSAATESIPTGVSNDSNVTGNDIARNLVTTGVATSYFGNKGAASLAKEGEQVAKKSLNTLAKSDLIEGKITAALGESDTLNKAASAALKEAESAKRASNVAKGIVTAGEAARDAEELKRLSSISDLKLEAKPFMDYAAKAKGASDTAVKTAKETQAALESTVPALASRSGKYATEAADLAKVAGKYGKYASVGGKIAKGLGKVSGIADIATMGIEGFRLATDEDLRKQRVDELKQAAGKSALESGLQGFFNPVGTLYAGGKLVQEDLNTLADARASAQNLSDAQKLQEVALASRRAKISDEDFKKLSTKERIAISREAGLSKKFTPQ